MSFDEVRLPDDIERGALIGPSFRTQITTLQSGAEQRNIQYEFPRLMIDAGYGAQDKDNYRRVLEFFYARQGRARGFRFKDWTDYEITNQIIALGDGVRTQFQAVKTYESGSVSFSRPIVKPIGSTFIVTVNGAVQTPTIDDTTGVITFSSAPGVGLPIAIQSGEFDVPVRFDTDMLQVSALWERVGTIPNVPIIEIRQRLQVI